MPTASLADCKTGSQQEHRPGRQQTVMTAQYSSQPGGLKGAGGLSESMKSSPGGFCLVVAGRSGCGIVSCCRGIVAGLCRTAQAPCSETQAAHANAEATYCNVQAAEAAGTIRRPIVRHTHPILLKRHHYLLKRHHNQLHRHHLRLQSHQIAENLLHRHNCRCPGTSICCTSSIICCRGTKSAAQAP